jgi:hypothetical protein
VASGFGGRQTDWFRNLHQCPVAEVRIAREHFAVVASELTEDEAVSVLADYEHRNLWIAPVFRFGFSWLLGRGTRGAWPPPIVTPR